MLLPTAQGERGPCTNLPVSWKGKGGTPKSSCAWGHLRTHVDTLGG